MVAAHAKKLDGVGGAEFDDLEQEGLIAVWEALRDGHRPSNFVVQNAMKDWVRKCARRGFSEELTEAVAAT